MVVTPTIGGEPANSPSMCLSMWLLNGVEDAVPDFMVLWDGVDARPKRLAADIMPQVCPPPGDPKGLLRDLVGDGDLLDSGGSDVPM